MFALLFDPSAGAAGDMIMASLLDLGADEKRVSKAVESVGCTLEVSRQEKGHISATRAQVISDRRYHSLEEAVSILKSSSLQEPSSPASLPHRASLGRRAGLLISRCRGVLRGMCQELVKALGRQPQRALFGDTHAREAKLGTSIGRQLSALWQSRVSGWAGRLDTSLRAIVGVAASARPTVPALPARGPNGLAGARVGEAAGPGSREPSVAGRAGVDGVELRLGVGDVLDEAGDRRAGRVVGALAAVGDAALAAAAADLAHPAVADLRQALDPTPGAEHVLGLDADVVLLGPLLGRAPAQLRVVLDERDPRRAAAAVDSALGHHRLGHGILHGSWRMPGQP